MKKTKIVIPALGLLLLSTAASVTGTVAWFSANTSVKVTGMAVTTKVSGNLLIASANTSDDLYRAADLEQGRTGILEPVSTIDGISYYFTKDDISGTGTAADTSVFKDYAVEIANTTGIAAGYANAFEEYYKIAGAKGYVDYNFYLKATSAAANDKVVLSDCNILYNTTGSTYASITDKAWRVAVFASTVNEGATGSDAAVADNKAILGLSNAKYFSELPDSAGTRNAVDSLDSSNHAVKNSVSNYNPNSGVVIGTIATAGVTQRYFVTVRLWLEGEDSTCTNETYAQLTNQYKLDLECSLVASSDTTTAVKALDSTAA